MDTLTPDINPISTSGSVTTDSRAQKVMETITWLSGELLSQHLFQLSTYSSYIHTYPICFGSVMRDLAKMMSTLCSQPRGYGNSEITYKMHRKLTYMQDEW